MRWESSEWSGWSWSRWYAWHPVKTKHGTWVWLEYVYRKYEGGYAGGSWDYLLPEEVSPDGSTS